jgi:CheY-like chemotaxis protein
VTLTDHSQPLPALSARSPNSVLVVEDDRDALEMLTLYLEFCGYVVHSAADGIGAVEMAVRLHPRIILMDLMMPRMDGWEATRQLKANARTSDITIIALSAGSLGDNHIARYAGCDAFIAKPCDLEYLGNVLRDFFDGRSHPWTTPTH